MTSSPLLFFFLEFVKLKTSSILLVVLLHLNEYNRHLSKICISNIVWKDKDAEK